MKNKLAIVLIGSLIYSVVFSFISKDIHITNLVANFAIPLIPSLSITLIIELIKTITKKEYKFNNFSTLLYKIWTVIIILFVIGNLVSYLG